MATSEHRRREIADRLAEVTAGIDQVCSTAGRTRDDVKLIVVTKYFPYSDVAHVNACGVHHVGENKAQELAEKSSQRTSDDQLTRHFIGQLQSNKAGLVAQHADWVHSIDRPKIATALSRAAQTHHRELQGLVQINLDPDSGPDRGGCQPENAIQLAEHVAAAPGLTLRGVMAVAPQHLAPADAFSQLAEIAGTIRGQHSSADQISAGMSGDYPDAINHGATFLRIGAAVLGSRPVVG